jgi:tetratricopeptide (TPR) repeat protein
VKGIRPVAGLAALVGAVSIAVYTNALRGELLYDDVPDIVRNRLVRDFEVARIVTEPSWATWVGIGYAGYRPVTTLTFALNHAVHGLAPVGWHAVNVALHAAVSALLVVLLVRLDVGVAVAALAGVLFATHPVHTEAVASVVGRADVLSTLLALLCWWLLLGRGGGLRAAAAALMLALAVLAKESAVALVGVILAVDLLAGRACSRWRRHALLVVAALGALAWRSAVLLGSPGGVTTFDSVLAGMPYRDRISTTLAIALRYVEKLVWPLHLSADYSYRQIDVVSWSDPLCFLGLAVLVGLALATMTFRGGAVRLGLVLLAVPLLAVLLISFLALGPPLAERLLYLPSAGFCLLLALAIHGFATRGAASRTAAWVTTAAVVAAYFGLTVARNRVWRTPAIFFETMVADAPLSARSHRELGNFLGEQGQVAAAVRELETSMVILPNPGTAYSLGNVLAKARRPDEAIAAYGRALELKADFVEAMTNLATTYGDKGDDQAAVALFERVLELRPSGFPELHMNYANSLQRMGLLSEAAGHYEKAVALAPGDAAVRFNYGVCLERLGRPADAVGQYGAAIAARPDWPAPHERLVAALLTAGQRDAALRAQERAERRFPNDPAIRARRNSLSSS